MNLTGYAVALIGLALFDVVVTGILCGAAVVKRWPALIERALASLAITGGVCLAALLGWNILDGWGWTAEQRLNVLFLALVVPSLASVSWLVALVTGKLSGESGQ